MYKATQSIFQVFALFLFAISSAYSQSGLAALDGNWTSEKWKYGYTLQNGIGTATSTNSPNFKVGQNIIQLTATSNNTFSGRQVYTDGKFYNVKAILQSDGRLYFEGEKNVKWVMERVDPAPQSSTSLSNTSPQSVVASNNTTQASSTPGNTAQGTVSPSHSAQSAALSANSTQNNVSQQNNNSQNTYTGRTIEQQEREAILRQQQQKQERNTINQNILTSLNSKELCSLIEKSPALNRYADAIIEAEKSIGRNDVNTRGLESKDNLAAQWIGIKFKEAFPTKDLLSIMSRSEEIISLFVHCAWELRDTKFEAVFSASKGRDFYWENAKEYENYKKKVTSVGRTIDSSGNVKSDSTNVKPFEPKMNGLRNIKLNEPEKSYQQSSFGYAIPPRRFVPVIALAFVGGEKVLDQITNEHIDELNKTKIEIANKKLQDQKTQDEIRNRALDIIGKTYVYYSSNFPSTKQSCEKDMRLHYENAAKQVRDTAKSSRNAKGKDDQLKEAVDLEKFNEAYARSSCFIKFYTEAEIALFESYLTAPDDLVFKTINENQITEKGKNEIDLNLKLNHLKWVQKRISMDIQDQIMVGIRAVKFSDTINNYVNIMTNYPQFGCKVEGEKIKCS